MKKQLLLVIAIVISIMAYGGKYYISPSGSDGAGNGSLASPWKTLAKATSVAVTNKDTIFVLPGTYTETVRSYLKPGVSIVGQSAATCIIKSTITGNYGELINLQAPDGTVGNQEISHITFDGNYVSANNYKTALAIWITGVSNVSIHDCVIKNFMWRGVIFNGINQDNPGTDVGKVHAKGNKFYNNTVTNCADYGPLSGGGSGALNIGFQDGMLIYNNTITQLGRPEGKNGWPIKYWNQGWNQGCKIYNNVLTKQPYGGSYPGESGWDFCIELFSNAGLEIYNNTIQGSIDLNYNFKKNYGYCAWIHDNIIGPSVPNTKSEGGIIFEFRTEAAIVENNILRNLTYGITYNTRGVGNRGGDRLNTNGDNIPQGYSFIPDNVIRNNLFTGLYYGTGISNKFAIGVISEGTDDPQVNNMQIYNNTIQGASGINGIEMTSQSNGGKITNFIVRNNIFQGVGNSVYANAATTQSGISINTNDYYQSVAPVWSGNGVTITGNLNLNPQFDATYHTTNSTLIAANIGWGIGSTPPPTNCTYTYTEYGPCVNGVRTRQLLSATPSGCVQNPPPVLSESCTVPNVPPTADAGPNQTITLPTNNVILSGSGNDSDGSVASYLWNVVSGPSGSVLSSPNTPSTALNVTNAGTYVVRLTVTDNAGATGSDNATIVVNPAQTLPAPTITDLTLVLPGNLTIKGTNFTGAVIVKSGGVNATSVTVVDPQTITAVITTLGDVIVTTPNGSATKVFTIKSIETTTKIISQ